MRTALVTGSSGFLGQHFVRALEAAGLEITGVDIEPGPTTSHVAEIRNFMRRSVPSFDYIFHFAAPVGGREKIEGDPLYNAESLSIDSELFRWVANSQNKPDIVYPSSSAVYGAVLQDGKRDQPLTEGLFHPEQHRWFSPDEMYGFTKLAGEYLAWKSARYGVNTLCIRPFSGYGEGQRFEYPVPSIAARTLRQENPLVIWGSGKQTRDFVHVDDIVRITMHRLDYPLRGYYPLNIGSGHGITFRQIAEICAELVGYNPAILADATKPEGVRTRRSDTGRQHLYTDGRSIIGLRDGLKRVLADVEQRLKETVPA
jgi:UDP-glucose 4-epimerase